jgi:pyruvate formate lyase activating enzyme
MSGGFTLVGANPLVQHRFVGTADGGRQRDGDPYRNETNGRWRSSERRGFGFFDLVLLGIKTWGDERNRHLTGKDLGPTLDFARRLAQRKRPIWVRFVLVPGLTDDENIIRPIAKFAAGLGNVERVEVLPFHQMGRYKWKELGLNYTLHDAEPPSNEAVQRACSVFTDEGLKAY